MKQIIHLTDFLKQKLKLLKKAVKHLRKCLRDLWLVIGNNERFESYKKTLNQLKAKIKKALEDIAEKRQKAKDILGGKGNKNSILNQLSNFHPLFLGIV